MSMWFVWGQVIRRITMDFDGDPYEIIKYHPWRIDDNGNVLKDVIDWDKTFYHVDRIKESFYNFDAAVIGILVDKNLGRNNQALSYGIARAIGCPNE